MAGLFDDVRSSAPAGGGLFDDIGADPLRGVDFKALGSDQKKARAVFDSLPKEHRDRAKAIWADQVVEDAHNDPNWGWWWTADDYLRRFTSYAPGDSWGDEINASINEELFGYDRELGQAVEQARTRYLARTETPGAETFLGRIELGDLAAATGGVASAIAAPYGKFVGGSGALAQGANVGINAGLYGAFEGAGAAERGERLEGAIRGGVNSAVIGAPLGAALGRVLGTAGGRAATKEANAITEAADRIGVKLPRAAAAGDDIISWGTREAAAGLGSVPLIGSAIPRAAAQAVDDMAGASARIAEGFSRGATQASAGATAKRAITEWIKTGSKETTARLWKDVYRAMPYSATGSLSSTAKAAKKLVDDDLAAASTVNRGALKMVAAALKKEDGLTFAGMHRLRTNIGAAIDDALLPAAGTTKPALKQLYEALSDDLERFVRNSGGKRGVEAWERAVEITKKIAARQEALTKIVGKSGEKPGESIVDTLLRYASTKETADFGRLLDAKKVLGDVWDEVAAAAIPRMGRNQSNGFSPAIFLKNYSQMSEAGRKLLFAGPGKQRLSKALDDLAKVSERFQALDRLRNFSGTARGNIAGSLVTGGAAATVGVMAVLKAAVPAYIMARWLAAPSRVRQMTRLGEALYSLNTGKASGPALSQAVAQLSIGLADATNTSPEDAQARLMAAIKEAAAR